MPHRTRAARLAAGETRHAESLLGRHLSLDQEPLRLGGLCQARRAGDREGRRPLPRTRHAEEDLGGGTGAARRAGRVRLVGGRGRLPRHARVHGGAQAVGQGECGAGYEGGGGEGRFLSRPVEACYLHWPQSRIVLQYLL